MARQRQEGDSWMAEWISFIPKFCEVYVSAPNCVCYHPYLVSLLFASLFAESRNCVLIVWQNQMQVNSTLNCHNTTVRLTGVQPVPNSE